VCSVQAAIFAAASSAFNVNESHILEPILIITPITAINAAIGFLTNEIISPARPDKPVDAPPAAPAIESNALTASSAPLPNSSRPLPAPLPKFLPRVLPVLLA